MSTLEDLLDAVCALPPGAPAPAGMGAAIRAEVARRAAETAELQAAVQAQATEREAALKAEAAAAREDAEAKARFISVLSHEIRTPLNGVLAVAELLEKEPLGPAAAGYARTVVDSSRTLLRVLSDALELNRGGKGEAALPLSPAPEPLRALADELEGLWRPRATAEGARLLVGYIGEPTLTAVVDGVRLRQVLNNLVGNALKFAGAGTVELILHADAGDDGLRLKCEVRDTGPGVEPDMLERIFEPFAQTDLGRARGGAGLGLAVARRIAEAMDGRLTVTNNPGRGATFTLELLLPQAQPQRHEHAPAPAPTAKLDRAAHVLVVDDNATNRMVAQTLCRLFGCSSETAEDGAQAVELAGSGAFDLVLMDIRMPKMDGVAATRAIRALPGPAARTPIIALTANADAGAAREYVAAGMTDVVEKPIQSDRLLAAMRAALDAAGEDAQSQAA